MSDVSNYQQILIIIDECEAKCDAPGMTGQGVLCERLKAYHEIMDVCGRVLDSSDGKE